eukprot:70899-Amorphochlora_amoeboformis.AAC.1
MEAGKDLFGFQKRGLNLTSRHVWRSIGVLALRNFLLSSSLFLILLIPGRTINEFFPSPNPTLPLYFPTLARPSPWYPNDTAEYPAKRTTNMANIALMPLGFSRRARGRMPTAVDLLIRVREQVKPFWVENGRE